MEFSRDGKHAIRCIITEEEIEELGYTIDDIISNGERTQEFMNCIFDMAEQKLQIKFETGIKTVHADILPNHTVSLTFSERMGTENIMEHIKDILNGLLSSIPKEKWDEIQAMKQQELSKARIIVLFLFEDLEVLMRYAKQIRMAHIPYNQLYKLENAYFLMIDMTDCQEEEVKYLSALTDEYAADIFVGAEKRAFIYEHGTALISEAAIEQLQKI